MAQYKRWLSYLFEYNNDAKGENCGFSRIEMHGEINRIHITVRSRKAVELLHICGFYRENGRCICVPLGRMMIHDGGGQFQYTMKGPQIPGTDIFFERLGGVVLSNPEFQGRAYAAVWDNEPFDLSMFGTEAPYAVSGEQQDRIKIIKSENEAQKKHESRKEINSDDQAEIKSDNEAEEKISSAKKSVAESIKEAKLENETDDKSGKALDSKEKSDIRNNPDPAEKSTERMIMQGSESDSEPIQAQAIHSLYDDPEAGFWFEDNGADEKREEAAKRKEAYFAAEQIWQTLCRKYPRVETLPGEDFVCLRAMPADIGRLPRPNWIFGNNGFLMYSYVRFRYIVFARLTEGKYELWVPGTYYQNEELLAEMFGFGEFRSTKSYQAEEGDFGYWCVPLMMPGIQNQRPEPKDREKENARSVYEEWDTQEGAKEHYDGAGTAEAG